MYLQLSMRTLRKVISTKHVCNGCMIDVGWWWLDMACIEYRCAIAQKRVNLWQKCDGRGRTRMWNDGDDA